MLEHSEGPLLLTGVAGSGRTETLARRLAALAGRAEQALALGLDFTDPASAPAADAIRWYDFTGYILAGQLRAALPQMRALDLPDSRVALLYLDDPRGLLRIAAGNYGGKLGPFQFHLHKLLGLEAGA